MPPERREPQKRRQLPFKPPRPATTTTAESSKSASASTSAAASKPKPKVKPKSKTTTTKPSAKASSSKSIRAQKPPREEEESEREAEEEEEADRPGSARSGSENGSAGNRSRSNSRSRSPSEEPDYILAEITHGDEPNDVITSEPAIPAKLLTRLLHTHFQNEKTKLAKDANGVVAKYVDVFVREALARAAYERAEGGGGSSIGDGFLEVEDLEKMAPQLALDF